MWRTLLVMLALAGSLAAADDCQAGRAFIDAAQIVSNCAKEQYAHQSCLRFVHGVGYCAYQCNETSPEENKPGQVARLAIFDILKPAGTARWVDVASGSESSHGVTLAGRFVSAPMLHVVNEDTVRIFFTGKCAGDGTSAHRVFFKDYTISTGQLSGLHAVQCRIARRPELHPLAMEAVQAHLSFLLGAGVGESFKSGLSTACDYTMIDGELYSAIQAKYSEGGTTKLLTNVLMRSRDHGATWELLGAPDPRELPESSVRILAEPALSWDAQNIYLHLRSNVAELGYMLSQTPRANPWRFSKPVQKWTYGVGRPTVCDFGPPIGLVAIFTAKSVPLGPQTLTRNKCEVVQIDPKYETYTKAFSIVNADGVNTPFMHAYGNEIYVTFSTGQRQLLPKFGTSEVRFSRLRREFFVRRE